VIRMKKFNFDKKRFNSKSFKYGSYAFAATAVVVAVVVLLNAILGLDVIRDRLRFDITKNKKFSLSQQSLNILKEIDKDVEIIILTEEKDFKYKEILEILKQYNLKSDGKVVTRFVDVEKDPLFIQRELDPEQVKGISAGSIVVKSGNKNRVISNSDLVEYDYSYGYPTASGLKVEQAFTSAIKNVTAEVTRVAYFAKGHGEIELDKELTDLKAVIAANNYEVKELSLVNEIPEDASVIFFVSPKTDLLPKELENLLAYLENGGDAIFLMDVQRTNTSFANFDTVLERYALALNNDFVLEGDQNWYFSDFNIIIPQPNDNDITKNLDPNSLFLYMPNCRSVSILKAEKSWITTKPLFMTSQKSQSTDLVTNKVSAGPFYLGAISEYAGKEPSKVALIGNATFITDSWMESAGTNGVRYIISTLNWMQDEKDSIYIPAKSLVTDYINLTAQSRLIAFLSLTALLPLMIIGFGVFVGVRRRHL